MSMSPLLLVLDPGIDEIGAAIFDLAAFEERRRTVQPESVAAAGALVQRLFLRGLSPKHPHHRRLAHLTCWVRDVCGYWLPDAVVIEMPAMLGTYDGGKRRDRAVEKLWQAVGAIQAGITSPRVEQIRAPSREKDERHVDLERCLRMAGQQPETNEHVADAIWLGLFALSTRNFLTETAHA